jgi:hypothetical protein
LTPNETTYLQKLDTAVKLLATLPLHKLDSSPDLLDEAFTIAYDEGLFNLHEYGHELQNPLKLELFSALCPLSGSLAFLAVQILAGNRIMQGNGFAKADEYYKMRCGIAINHLRAPVTVVDSVKSDSGYKLTGRLTWASGYGIFDTLVVGFHHDGKEMQAVMPFVPQPGCIIGEPDTTFVGLSMNTVNIDLEGYEIPEENIICSHPIGQYTQQKSVSKTVHMALYGIGLGAVMALEDDDVITEAAKRLDVLKEAFMGTDDGERMDELRIELFNLVQQIVTTGIVLYGGKSILAEKALQRYYRELIMFNSNGLNDTIKGLFKKSFMQS